MAPSVWEEVASARMGVIESGKHFTRRANIVNLRNGAGWIADATYFPVRDADSKIVAVGVHLRDASAEIQAEDALRAARDSAGETELAKTRFLASVSHDLRQPAQAALMFADALRLVPGDPGVHASLMNSLETLGGMLHNMLDISGLYSGAVSPEITDFPIGELLLEIRESYEPAARAKGIGLVVVETSAIVRSDRVLVGRIVRNITENAVRHTAAGRVLIDCVPRQDGRILVKVIDSGIGIPVEGRERIWDEFFQLRNPERDRGRGLGLGLAIVRRAAALIDCEITLESTPGEGSTFGILLPGGMIPVPASADDGDSLPRVRPTSAAGGRRRVLVVEDDGTLLEGLRLVLVSHGYEVFAAGDGDEALEAVAGGFLPDVVVADYRLPGGSVGSSVIRDVVEAVGRATAGILLTGENGPEPGNDAMRMGYRLLRKPVPPHVLLELIAEMAAPLPSA